MENFSLTGSSEVSSRVKRQNTDWTSTACYPDEGTEDLDHPTCDAANAALDAQCGGGSVVRAGYDFYSISGCVVAYFCNFGWGARACYASDRQRGSARITQVCGWYKPGSVRYNDITPVISYSYGYESYCTARGHNFCGRGT
ncbi:hypothetical protein L207DRAFT_517738 [Hyaloscypha variabilis F]|uniref:Uncharacterized protein n=1 Tax=Hyaloscypha variabilis (strain UAMH 11265 / GT02V1 / F) TaxID=1149755 RepID=A0A2J6R5A3_HYAVF|nr:hypothetical protein L207DRAFT_517738 [Hyaloscypha variabilis F]